MCRTRARPQVGTLVTADSNRALITRAFSSFREIDANGCVGLTDTLGTHTMTENAPTPRANELGPALDSDRDLRLFQRFQGALLNPNLDVSEFSW